MDFDTMDLGTMDMAALMLAAAAVAVVAGGVYQTKTRRTMARDWAKMEGKGRRCRHPNG
jgi:hypothetical protein